MISYFFKRLVLLSVLTACGSNTTSPIGGNVSSEKLSSSSKNHSSRQPVSSLVQSSSSQDRMSSSSLAGPALDTAWGQIAYEGKTYKTITIQGRTWFAENLDVGTMVQGQGSLSHQDDDNMVEKFCYSDIAEMCDSFGGLYEWTEAMALPIACNQTECMNSMQVPHRGICPEHWHIPSTAEMDSLISLLGGESIAGFYAKGKSGYSSWDEAWNSLGYSGFNVLPSGMRESSGSYVNSGKDAHFWTTEEFSSEDSRAYSVWNTSESFVNDLDYKTSGYSVRCVKDE